MRTPKPDEEFFQARLDADPADQATRRQFAEWLIERGDERGEGYRWMVWHGKWAGPDMTRSIRGQSWDWWSMLPGWNHGKVDNNERPDRLDPQLFDALDQFAYKSNWADNGAYCEFHSREAAEEALVRALVRLRRVGP